MKLYGANIEFPGELLLSFDKLLQSIEGRLDTASPHERTYLEAILTSADKYPELRTGIERDQADKYQEVIDELMAIVFPKDLTRNEIKCASAPWDFSPIYISERLKRLMTLLGSSLGGRVMTCTYLHVQRSLECITIGQ